MGWFSKQADEPKPVRRRGILEGSALGGGFLNKGVEYHWVAEVEELERIGHLSKLRYGNITGADRDMLIDMLPEWMPTKEIIWADAKDEGSDDLSRAKKESLAS